MSAWPEGTARGGRVVALERTAVCYTAPLWLADLEVYDEQVEQRHWRELLGLLRRTIGAAPQAPGPGSAIPRPPG